MVLLIKTHTIRKEECFCNLCIAMNSNLFDENHTKTKSNATMLGKMPKGKIAPGKMPPGKVPPGKLPPGNKPPRKIAPRKIAPHSP